MSTIKIIDLESNSFKTVSIRKEDVQKRWFLVDASDQNLGRMCSKVAKILRGKHKPSFTPHVDCGDNVVIINADKIRLSGEKLNQKEYIRHTGYPGGQRSVKAKDLLEKDSARIIKMAVKGMLPKNPLGRAMFSKLKVYAGETHPHAAQQPKELNI